jgi:hypothetical protein
LVRNLLESGTEVALIDPAVVILGCLAPMKARKANFLQRTGAVIRYLTQDDHGRLNNAA